MRKQIIIGLSLALVLTAATTSQADDLFQLYWRGTYYTKDATGHIVAVQFSEQEFVKKIAQDNNLDPSTLVFVYRPDKHDTAVVRASDGTFIADVIQMEYNYTDVVNPTGSVIVRHALLYDEYHQTPLGSFFGLEMITRTAGGALANETFNGTAIYSKPDTGLVYSARIWTGSRVVDRSGN